MGKTNSEVQRNFNANTKLLVLFKIGFKSLFFHFEKKIIQWMYDNGLGNIVAALFKRDAFRPCWDWNNYDSWWWLTSNHIDSRAINNKWDKLLKNGPTKICGRQLLKLKAVFHKFYLVHSWIPYPFIVTSFALVSAGVIPGMLFLNLKY